MTLDEREELEQLRRRVRASRRATSAPMVVFGAATLVFAGYQGAVHYSFVPAPLYWPLCSLLALIVLAGFDGIRRGGTGVGPGRVTYARAAAALVAVVVVGNLMWLLPFAPMVLWPAPVLAFLALWQRNTPLAVRAGIVAAVMVGGWFVRLLVSADWFHPLVMAAGGLALVLGGLIARAQERTIG